MGKALASRQLFQFLILTIAQNQKIQILNRSNNLNRYFEKGWCQFEYDPKIAHWIDSSLAAARSAITDPTYSEWIRHEGTWFVGVNALNNDEFGSVGLGPPISGMAVDFINTHFELGNFAWDRAQVSVCYPGYPAPSEAESEKAYRFRLNRDAAHIDGLRREGPDQRRFLKEYHGFILGIPMVEFSPEASPFVVWEGSHNVAQKHFLQYFQNHKPETWHRLDLTEMYQSVRRQIFQQCKRVELWAQPGEVFLAHRLVLHGIAPWTDDASADQDGRIICYFRPETGGPWEWLHRP